MVSSTLAFPEVGQTVVVDWGLDEVTGRVVEVYGAGPLARVRVELPILGPSGEELDSAIVSLPLEVVHPR
jgi:hypothetical protein